MSMLGQLAVMSAETAESLGTVPDFDGLICGPAMFLTPDEVRSMAVELSGVSEEHIAAALARHVSDLYPQLSDRADEADELSFFTIEATRKAISLFERAALLNAGALFVVL
jgi:hypothetical protein